MDLISSLSNVWIFKILLFLLKIKTSKGLLKGFPTKYEAIKLPSKNIFILSVSFKEFLLIFNFFK